jgi:hypothetical protein
VIELGPLLALLRKLGGDASMVRSIAISPAVLERLRLTALPGAVDTFGGIDVERSAHLLDHMVMIKFADGRMGYWDMRTDRVNVWNPAATTWSPFAPASVT